MTAGPSTNRPIDLSVLIPAYEEAENLRVLLPRLSGTLRSMSISAEIIAIDTNPPLDNTDQVCAEYSSENVRAIPREQGPSFGSAYRTGIRNARGRHILFMDGDGSHDPELIPKLYALRDKADVISASRYTEGGETENTWLLKQMSYAVNLTFRVIFRINCKDVSNSFKLYDGNVLRQLPLSCENFDIIEEILIRLRRSRPNFRIIEVPCTFHQRLHGVTKRKLALFIVTYAWTLVRLMFLK